MVAMLKGLRPRARRVLITLGVAAGLGRGADDAAHVVQAFWGVAVVHGGSGPALAAAVNVRSARGQSGEGAKPRGERTSHR